MIDSGKQLSTKIESGTLTIPPPSDSVKEWPLIGEQTHQVWSLASTNLEAAANKDKIKAVGKTMLSGVADAGGTVLQFILSLIIAGVLLANAEGGQKLALFKTFTGKRIYRLLLLVYRKEECNNSAYEYLFRRNIC